MATGRLQSVWVFALLLVLCVLFRDIRFLSAQEPPLPDPDFADALWVATEHGILKVAPVDGSVLTAIHDIEDVQALALDERAGTLWAYGDKTLHAIGFNGEILFDVSLRRQKDHRYRYKNQGRHRRGWDDHDRDDDDRDNRKRNDDDDDDNDAVFLRVDSDDGSVWLGVGKQLYRFDKEGERLLKKALRDEIEDLDWDPVNSRLWIASEESVAAFDTAGEKVLELDLGWKPEVEGIAVVKDTGELWVSLENRIRNVHRPWWRWGRSHRSQKLLRRYTANGSQIFEAPVDWLGTLDDDGQGGVWMAEDEKLARLDSTGQVVADLKRSHKQTGKSDKIVDTAVDYRDGSVWVAGKKVLRHVGTEGEIIQTLESKRTRHRKRSLDWHDGIAAIALYTDLSPPTLQFSAPSEGSFLNTGFPALHLSYSDIGTGVDPSTLSILSNGSLLPVSCTFAEALLTCTPNLALPEGSANLTATVRDFSGNVSSTASVNLFVDTTLPEIAFTSPINDTQLDTPKPTIEVAYSDSGSGIDPGSFRLFINGVGVTAGNTVSPTGTIHNPVDALPNGEYEVIATVADLAGNTRSATTRFTIRAFQAFADCGPVEGEPPLRVTYRSRGEFPGGTLVKYRWDFQGDGVFDTTDTVPFDYRHTLQEKGLYVAVLEVTNNFGETATDTCTIDIRPALASLSATADVKPSNGPAPLTVKFTGRGTFAGRNIILHEWDFDGDGIFDYSKNPLDPIPQPTAIVFHLNQINCFSSTDPADLETNLYLNDILVGTTDAAAGCACGIEEHTLTISDPAALSNWNATGDNILRVEFGRFLFVGYLRAEFIIPGGTTEVCVFDALNGLCATRNICAALEFGESANTSVDLQGNNEAITSVFHTYTAQGSFQPVFRVTDDQGTSATASPVSTFVNVGQAGSPVVEAFTFGNDGFVPITVGFDGSATDDGAITQWEWDFDGDGQFDYSSPTSPATSFTYTTPGTHIAVLRVTDDTGLTGIDQVEVTAKTTLSANLSIPTDTFKPTDGATVPINTSFRTLSPQVAVRILVKDVHGVIVRTLVDENRPPGDYSDAWDGRDGDGRVLPSGVYFIVLEASAGNVSQTLDFTYSTGGTRYSPSRNSFPSTFHPFDDDLLPLTFTVSSFRGASEIIAYIGSFFGGNRFITLLERVPFGVGTHTVYWDGLDLNGNIAVPPPGDRFLLGIFGYTLPDNAILLEGAPIISNVAADPNYFDPSTPDFISPMNPTTTVTYDLDKTADIELTITNLTTQKVLRRIRQPNAAPGTGLTIQWDGLAEDGRFADKGDYRLALKATDSTGNQSLVRYVLMRVFY